MWKTALLLLILTNAISGATVGELEESSFDFLNKYTQKQYRSIVSLKISNASVNKIDPKLKYLKNLKYLDLSHNNVQISTIPLLNNLKTLKLNGNSLKYINMTALPSNLEVLDISNNLLTQIPKDWRSLRSLRILNLHKNPIDCECMNVLNYDRIIKSGISVPESVSCHSPNKYLAKDIDAVNCSLDDIMLYDEPYEGSGTDDIFEENLTDQHHTAPYVEEEEEHENNTIIDDKVPEEELIVVHTTQPTDEEAEIQDEGSGDEGSGNVEMGLPESGVLGCIENCTTPGPVGANDEEYASPLPGLVDQVKILWEDLNFGKFLGDPTTTTTTTTTTEPTTVSTTTEAITTAPVVVEKPFIKDPRIYKETESKPIKTSDKGDDVELIKADNTTDEQLERASAVPQNSTAIYAVIGVFAFVAVLFLICFIKQRKNRQRKKNRRRDIPNSLGEELKPLSKTNMQAVSIKPLKNSQNIPEHIPLINGQNGAPKNESPILKSFTPLAHPERLEEPLEEEIEPELELPTQQNGISDVHDDVELRPKYQPELLTPQRERVTIRESEIPDSVPKTPLLVHRQKNSEGEIVTTVVP